MATGGKLGQEYEWVRRHQEYIDEVRPSGVDPERHPCLRR
jgi:hypothetical protein